MHSYRHTALPHAFNGVPVNFVTEKHGDEGVVSRETGVSTATSGLEKLAHISCESFHIVNCVNCTVTNGLLSYF